MTLNRDGVLGLLLVSAGLASMCLVPAQALEVKKAGQEKANVGKSTSQKGMILSREGPMGRPWSVIAENGPLRAGDMILGLPGATMDSANDAVHLTMRSDLDANSPFPIIENAIVLVENEKKDLDFHLDRGRVDVANCRKEGPAHVCVRVRKDLFDLTLEKPGTRVAMEVYGRWARGKRFTKTLGPKDVPTTSLVILVLNGEASLHHELHHFAMVAPPGNALIEWDSVTGLDEAPHRLKELPAWASSGSSDSELVKKKKATLSKLQAGIASKPVPEVLEELLASDDVSERRAAVYCMGATDDLKHLGQALRQAKNPDVWDNGVITLRHWIGRCPGQDEKLYQGLIENDFKPIQAETVIQLLHSFSEEDLSQPETYQVLIDYLSNENLAIRGLAHWHLYRLVPEGQKIGFNPLADKNDRALAVAKWKALVPPGKIPSAIKAQEK